MSAPLIPALALPYRHRRDFSKPRGIIVRGDLSGYLEEAPEPLTCVGDVVSGYCAETSKKHLVLVIDGKTRRSHKVSVDMQGFQVIKVVNPPGYLTLEAIMTVCRVEANPGRWLILVRGEEDMIALAALSCMPWKGTLVYGVPSIGATIIRANPAILREAQSRFLLLRPVLAETPGEANNTL
ncbi:MAG: DUF359 domain-containing protein [Desulfurococcales archaeon]|nr:DUF359 domain-containing protein [Desulfurococcales archaeon]